MHMVCHQVTFQDLSFLVARKLMEDCSQMPPDRSVNRLFAPLGDEHHVVLTIPTGMAQTLVCSHRLDSKTLGRVSERYHNRGNGQTDVSPPAKPGVYYD